MLPEGQTSELGSPENRNPESRVLDIFGPNLINTAQSINYVITET